MSTDLVPLSFIDQPIDAIFDVPLVRRKAPHCPDAFTWQGQEYRIAEMLIEWVDYTRKGRSARNMSPAHAAAASSRGSWGVGRFYFRVRVLSGQIFDLYYDRAPKDAGDRLGAWFLYREMFTKEVPV